MRRCWGLTRNLHQCGRYGEWRFFCPEHRLQPLIWISFVVFTVLGSIASMQSAWWPNHFFSDGPKPTGGQPLEQVLLQLIDRYGSFDQKMAPLGKWVELLSSHAQPIYAHVDLVDDEYRLLLKVSNQEEVASGNSADFPRKIQFSIRAEPIDVPYELSVAIDKEQVTYTVTVNKEFMKTALRSAMNP